MEKLLFMEGKVYSQNTSNMKCYYGIQEIYIHIYASKYTYVFLRSQQQRHCFVLKVGKNKLHASGTTRVCLFFPLSSLK